MLVLAGDPPYLSVMDGGTIPGIGITVGDIPTGIAGIGTSTTSPGIILILFGDIAHILMGIGTGIGMDTGTDTMVIHMDGIHGNIPTILIPIRTMDADALLHLPVETIRISEPSPIPPLQLLIVINEPYLLKRMTAW